jgi:putative DNA primase/helicase
MIDAELIARARDFDIVSTAERLGASLKRATATERVGPCPKCGGRDRFSVNIKRQLWICRGCGRGGGNSLDLVMHVRGLDFAGAVNFLTSGEARSAFARVKPTPAPTTDNGNNREKALALWREGNDPRGTLVERYLFGRKLRLDDGLVGEVLRWHPRIGAMLALFRNILTGEPQAVSRTFLDADGRKIERKFLGPTGGAAIKLDSDENVLGGLHVGEGVETCMAARAFGLRPAWALGSAGAIAAFPVLSGIECLTLLAEHDEASARAIQSCGNRWHAAGREVLVNRAIGGKDLADVGGASA